MNALPDLLTVSREVTDAGRTVHLHVVGEIDMSTVPTFNQAVASALDETPERVMIDLSEVEFMDSSGLNALVRARNAMDDRGGDLVISGMSDQVGRLFDLSGLTPAFTFST